MEKPYPVDSEVAMRVVAVRIAEGFDECQEFARRVGVSPTRLNNVENGLPLGKELAFRLVQAVPGLTTDWLWFGDWQYVPLELRRRLENALGVPRSSGKR